MVRDFIVCACGWPTIDGCQVCIVQKLDTEQMFAMKYMNKTQCIERDALKNVLREVEILKALEHPFLVNLWFSFQDEEDFFMVTDLLLGGDLRYHMQHHVQFSETSVKLLICEIALALDYLQSKCIIHRDIKPDNILLDLEGHAHLTDFNIAAILERGKLAFAMTGTKPYIAPEIFDCTLDICVGYSYPVDWWSLGVVAYEILRGCRPFEIHSNTTIKEVKALFRLGPDFPTHWSIGTVDLLRRLIRVRPGERISNIEELKRVKGLDRYDLEFVYERKYRPHFQPPKDRLNHNPAFEFDEVIVETKPLHKKQKRLAKQRSRRQAEVCVDGDVDSDPNWNFPTSIISEYKVYNRLQELERRERERKELEWEQELLTAMAASDPLGTLSNKTDPIMPDQSSHKHNYNINKLSDENTIFKQSKSGNFTSLTTKSSSIIRLAGGATLNCEEDTPHPTISCSGPLLSVDNGELENCELQGLDCTETSPTPIKRKKHS